MKISINKEKQNILLLAPASENLNINNDLFNPNKLREKDLIQKEMTGRGTVYFFDLPANIEKYNTNKALYALRHYYRGGLIGKFSADQYFYSKLKNTRCYQELFTLQYLLENGVNVPKPIAARVICNWPFYTADIITEVVPNAIELHEALLQGPVENSVWQEIGKQIGLMHKANLCHYDINVKNILIQILRRHGDSKNNDSNHHQSIFLIDFDKCAIKPSGTWKQSNILRLHRSLTKQQLRAKTYHFSEQSWQVLLSAYKKVQAN